MGLLDLHWSGITNPFPSRPSKPAEFWPPAAAASSSGYKDKKKQVEATSIQVTHKPSPCLGKPTAFAKRESDQQQIWHFYEASESFDVQRGFKKKKLWTSRLNYRCFLVAC